MSAIIRIINEHQGEVCSAYYTLCGLSIITDDYLVCNESCLILYIFYLEFHSGVLYLLNYSVIFQVSIVATGPLTNLALAVRLDPTLPQKLKSLYIMGGNTDCEYVVHFFKGGMPWKIVVFEIRC